MRNFDHLFICWNVFIQAMQLFQMHIFWIETRPSIPAREKYYKFVFHEFYPLLKTKNYNPLRKVSRIKFQYPIFSYQNDKNRIKTLHKTDVIELPPHI